MSLFLKYRPQNFADLVGQTAVKQTLKNALKAQNPAHAYLFSGSRGTGKTSSARIFAKGLNCESLQEGDPCTTCRFCTGTATGTLVDVVEIDAASNRGIDEIRDLRDKIQFAPSHAPRKIYIIDEVHMLTKEAFNALLKTLEEPPDHAYFCLATTEIHKVPETILSRCQTFVFQRFSLEQLVDRLAHIAEKESFKAPRESLEVIARKAEGGMRDAVSLLEQTAAETGGELKLEQVTQSLGVSDSETLQAFYDSLSSEDPQAGLEILKNIVNQGLDPRTFGHDFLGFCRGQMHAKLFTPQELPRLLVIIKAIETALERLKFAPIMELPLEIAVIELTTSIEPLARVTPSSATTRPAPSPKQTPLPPTVGLETNVQSKTPEAPKSESAELTPKPEIKPAAPAPDLESLGDPQRALSDLAEKAGLPVFVKKSLMTTVLKWEGDQLVFYTDSEFHREKLTEASSKNLLQTACQNYFEKPRLIIEVKKDASLAKAQPSKTTARASIDDFVF